MCRSDRSVLSPRQVKALAHPMRMRIVELFAKDAARSLSVSDLAGDLSPAFEGASLAQVSYHVRLLQQLELIPAPGRG